MDDILLKMGQTNSYKNQTEDQRINIETNLRVEFIDSIMASLYTLFEENNLLLEIKKLGESAEDSEELMQIIAGIMVSVPAISEYVVKSIVTKYKSLCDEMDFSYEPNIIHSLIKETV